MADRDAPTVLKTFDTNVLAVIAQSTDGMKALYSRTSRSTGSPICTDLRHEQHPGTLSSDTIAIPAGDFVTAGGMVAWARFNDQTMKIEGLYTTVGDCRSKKYAINIAAGSPSPTRALSTRTTSTRTGRGHARSSKAAFPGARSGSRAASPMRCCCPR
jgi:hypothetical protein